MSQHADARGKSKRAPRWSDIPVATTAGAVVCVLRRVRVPCCMSITLVVEGVVGWQTTSAKRFLPCPLDLPKVVGAFPFWIKLGDTILPWVGRRYGREDVSSEAAN